MSVRPRSLSLRRLVGLAILLGFVLLVIAGTAWGMRMYGHAKAIKQRLDRVQSLVGGEQSGGLGVETIKTLREELKGSQQDFLAIKRDLAPFLPVIARLGWLPKLGPTIAAAPPLLDMGEHFLAAAVAMFDGIDPLLQAVTAGPGTQAGSTTERLLQPLMNAQPSLVRAQDLIEKAVAERDRISPVGLLPLLARQLDRLDKYLPALRSGSQLAAIAPALLGAVRPMTYILLAQNNDELRPTGGLISAVGVLTIDRGRISRLEIKDSYSVDNWNKDHPTPPEPLTRFMDAQLWVFRDANFWPDFPTSAKAIEYFAELDLDIKPDGVIAMDQFALQMLVGGMGTVVVPEYNNDVLTGENTIAKIRAYWQPGRNLGEEWADWMKWYGSRKQFMTVLVQAMRARLESDLRSLNLPRFGKAVLQALNERHIQIYLREPLGSGLTSAANWGGAMTPTASDYLFVVDTNMGFNKVNGLIKQRLDYSVVIDDGGLARSQLLISYEHRGTRDVECLHESYYEITYDLMMDRCYWNYLRIYVPEGATLIADENGNDMENAGIEAGKQVWARWMMMARQDKPQVSMGYYQPLPVLSTTAAGREYRLVVQKQPGTDRTPLRVMVTLPAGVAVLGTRPAATRVAGNIVEFESTLATDQEFRVIIR